MVIRKKAATGSKKKNGQKPVIEHDPLSLLEEEIESIDALAVDNVIAESAVEANDAKKTVLPIASENADCIELGDSFVINEVEIQRNTLLSALQAQSELVLNGGEIQQIDGAGLQLLVAFIKEAEKTGISYKWNTASPVLCGAASQLGLTEVLQLNNVCKSI